MLCENVPLNLTLPYKASDCVFIKILGSALARSNVTVRHKSHHLVPHV